MAIQAVIFDLGGVLVRTADFTPRARLGARFGMTAEELMDLVFGLESGKRAQLGLVSAAQHWEHVRQTLGISPPELKEFLDIFWSEDHLDVELVDTLRRLRRTHRTALLSNALPDVHGLITDQLKIDDAFDVMVFSCEVGIMKPDARIYQLVLQQVGVPAGQAVFVDDTLRNVEAARAIGMQAIHYQSTPQTLAELSVQLQAG
mgnify:FL=1